MPYTSTILEHLGLTAWNGWLTDERLREHDAEPLNPSQRAAIGRILRQLAVDHDLEGERIAQRRADRAVTLVERLAETKIAEVTDPGITLADFRQQARDLLHAKPG